MISPYARHFRTVSAVRMSQCRTDTEFYSAALNMGITITPEVCIACCFFQVNQQIHKSVIVI